MALSDTTLKPTYQATCMEFRERGSRAETWIPRAGDKSELGTITTQEEDPGTFKDA